MLLAHLPHKSHGSSASIVTHLYVPSDHPSAHGIVCAPLAVSVSFGYGLVSPARKPRQFPSQYRLDSFRLGLRSAFGATRTWTDRQNRLDRSK